jgi:hypothetical protein
LEPLLRIPRVRFLALSLIVLGLAGVSAAKDVVIHAGTLFDGVAETPTAAGAD